MTLTATTKPSRSYVRRTLLPAASALLFAGSLTVQAQGVLTVSPSRSATTVTGTGAASLSGDGSLATTATVAAPRAVAYDAAGNLYIADTNNHVIREVVKATGLITTIAGTGEEGYAGDGGAATAALLDTPSGIAVDANGNVYIADTNNQRIRKISNGVITTIAGTGTSGFSGDGGAATDATLNTPSGIAIDASGNLYIADTNNQRIRRVSSTGTISTIAGNGEQGYTGDGASATSATLDTPTSVAVDTAGRVYIADSHNQGVRAISASGTISTIAGSGSASFAGGFSGDGASSTAASLAKPTGVSVDANGNVYIADTNNQRIRQLGGGVIQTISGTGEQGYGGDGGAATAAVLNTPHGVSLDASGNLAVADTLDHRVRGEALPSITYGSQDVGVTSTGQLITLANSGTASITVSTIAFTGSFSTSTGGTCPSTPITIAAGDSCTQSVSYLPTAVGSDNGSVLVGGTGVIQQSVLLTGTATQASSTTTVTTSLASVLATQSATFTAQVLPEGLGSPSGTVQFYANGTAIGSPITLLSSGLAALTTSFGTAGTYAITAIYSGDTNFKTSTSSSTSESVADYTIMATGTTEQSVPPSGTAAYTLQIAPIEGSFSYPITFAVSGAPAGTTITFSPSTVTPGSSTASVTMTVKAPALKSQLHRYEWIGGGTAAFAILLLPFGLNFRRKGQRVRPLMLCGVLLGTLGAWSMTGCSSGFFAQQPQTYTLTLTATATGTNGATLQHTSQVTLTVQ